MNAMIVILMFLLATAVMFCLFVLQDNVYLDLRELKILISIVVSFLPAYFIICKIKQIIKLKQINQEGI
jgi:hypothetical protein